MKLRQGKDEQKDSSSALAILNCSQLQAGFPFASFMLRSSLLKLFFLDRDSYNATELNTFPLARNGLGAHQTRASPMQIVDVALFDVLRACWENGRNY